MKKAFVALFAALVASLASAESAGTVYGGVGLPGVFAGYAHPINDSISVRADFATMGSMRETVREEGIEYEGKAKLSRAGAFVDWFVAGNFRLTGGVTFNNAKVSLAGRDDGIVVIGDQPYLMDPDDRIDVQVKFPSTTPYLGIGYGFSPKKIKGWGWAFDAGMSIGKPRVTGRATGPSLGEDGLLPVSQADLERELDEIRGDVAKIRGIPQVSLSLVYRF